MKYGDCYLHLHNNIKTCVLMCLGHNEDKKVTFLTLMFRDGPNTVSVGFIPYSTEYLEKEDIRFENTGSPNLISLKEQISYYNDICNKCDFDDTMVTCEINALLDMIKKLYQKFPYQNEGNRYFMPAIIPALASKLGLDYNKVDLDCRDTISVTGN